MTIDDLTYTRPTWGPWILTCDLALHYIKGMRIYVKFEDLDSVYTVLKHVCIASSTVYTLSNKLNDPIDPYISIYLSNAIRDVLKFSSIDLETVEDFNGKQAARKFFANFVVPKRNVSPKKRMDVLEKYRFKCAYCGATALDGVALEVDHIIPISKGGSNDMENLQILCKPCNIGKFDRIISFDSGSDDVHPA
jgi:5-methylcytosine-specific restriction enzyme A